MTRRRFTRFMVDVEIGSNLKVGRLAPAERWAFVAGVLPIAAKADPRGAFLVGSLPAEAGDVARQADVPKAVAARTIAKLRELGMLAQLDDWEIVHDWDVWNPAPKQDTTNAERQARFRARNAESNGVSNAVTSRPVTPAEVEVELEAPPKAPPKGGDGVVRFERKVVPKQRLDAALKLLDAFNAKAGTDYGAFRGDGRPSENLQRIIGALTRNPDVAYDRALAAIQWQLANPYWQGAPSTGNVFGANVFDRALASANGVVSEDHVGDGFTERLNSRRGDAA